MLNDIQSGFSIIADSEYSYRQKVGKYGYISDLLTYFKSEYSTVQVSSLRGHNKQIVRDLTVGNYLHRLAGLGNSRRKVRLEFDREKGIHIDNTYMKDGFVNVLASVYQIFESCKQTSDGKVCYSDVTKKTFVFKSDFTKNTLGNTYIDSIKVSETYSMEYYKNEVIY